MKLLKSVCKALFALVVFWFCFWWGKQVSEIFYSVDVWQPRLLLDAGHGGEDGGAVSVSGQKESAINLEITRKLDQVLAFLGEPAFLLREADISLHEDGAQTLREKKVSDLKHRVGIAGQYPGAVLVSIHQNSYPEEDVDGAQVFYYAGSEEGKLLGTLLQESLKAEIADGNHRVAKANKDYYLLKQSTAPAVIVECGFLSNEREAALLVTEEYQEKIAFSLLLGIMEYIHTTAEE